ncbi:unnamed protein product, partial [Mesorhabditis belari]|uniref:TLC domain-containing protein n=1 Tax=Mesorhabditis belari TaxID=2138241 RepID=A0AAF3FCX1_9BILA
MQLWGPSFEAFYTRPWHIFQVDNNTDIGDQEWASAMVTPDFANLIRVDILVPILCYSLFWYTVNVLVTANCWSSFQEGQKRKRLINVTTSLIHSSVSGFYFLIFFIRFPGLMFAAPMNYYGYLDTQILMVTFGYFIYDAYDLVVNDKFSIQTGVLLFHHVGAAIVISIVFASHKFVLFAYWALLMEVSSVFLHLRSIFHFSKMSSNSRYSEVTRLILWGNLISFIVFRFLNQIWMVTWGIVNRNNMHLFYLVMCMVAQAAFFLINLSLFLRILYSDGFMGSTKVSRRQLDALLEDNEYTALDQNGDREDDDIVEELKKEPEIA